MKGSQSQKNITTEWQQIKLGEISNIYDGTHQTPIYTETGVPFYSVEHVTSNNFNDTKFVSEDVFKKESKRIRIEEGDILMTRIGDVGTTKYISWSPKASFYVSLALIKSKKNINSKFINFVINSNEFKNELRAKTLTVAFPNKINLGDIGKCRLLLPLISEQNRIVSVLEAWDKAIEKLSNKIEIKKQIKKGLMQDLLTGKKRLKGFNKKWETKTIAYICSKENSNVSANTLDFNSGEYPVYGASGFIKSIDFFTQNKPYISIVKDGAGVGRLSLHKEKTSVLGTLNILHENNNSNLNFLYFLLQTIDFKKYITGSTIPHIYFKDYKKNKLLVPEFKEQIEIAKVITTADQEITALECKLKVLKEQKRYLLNNLIAGKIRTPETLLIKKVK